LPATAFVLLGPTASGKSRLALELAERRPVEIVSVDSALVYRGLDIGTAKPAPAERKRVPHHLIDLVEPDEAYSTGRWRADALAAIAGIVERGRIPLLVGGTMLYYRALVAGLDALPQGDAAVRSEIDAQAAARGWPALHADLQRIDPASAQRIQPGDAQRIQRALEVWRLTGQPLSALQGQSRQELPFSLRAFALVPSDRGALHAAIARRFDEMLAAGLVEELRALRQAHRLHEGLPSMRAVGYRQAWDLLEGRIDGAQMRSQAIAATRQLAKRQLTWLRSFADVEPLEAERSTIALQRLLAALA
jgi:tRNA dimethylallyltransferase